jgi:hypothetical protein
MSGRTGRRRRIAVVTCVLWLLAVEVLPNLHLATHDDDHTHDASGAIVRTSHRHDGELVDHDHGDDGHHRERPSRARAAPERAHAHAHALAPARGPRTRERLNEGPLLDIAIASHASIGIAHRALAIASPAPPCHAPVAVDRVVWCDPLPPLIALTATSFARPNARGPPVA